MKMIRTGEFLNLLDAFYVNNPVKIDIAGTVESISKINRDILYKCYNTFYHPSNMMILVVGDVEPKEVFGQIEESIDAKSSKPEIKRIFPEEPKTINRDYVEQKLAVAMPMFQMGFKDNDFNSKGIECLKREVAVKLILEMIMGRSSSLYNELYNEGLINNTFDFDYTIEENYAYSAFGGESKDPLMVKKESWMKSGKYRRTGLTKTATNGLKEP